MYSNYNVFTEFCAAVLEELHLRKTTIPDGRTDGRTSENLSYPVVMICKWRAFSTFDVRHCHELPVQPRHHLYTCHVVNFECTGWVLKTNFTTWQSHVLQWEFPTWVAIDRFLLILTTLFHPPFISLKALTCSRSMQHSLLTKNFDYIFNVKEGGYHYRKL